MKKNYSLIFGVMLSTSLLAQQVTNPPPSAPIQTPPPAPVITNTPTPVPSVTSSSTTKATKKAAAPTNSATKKSAAKKESAGKKASSTAKKASAPALRTVPLVAGPASVAASNVNVRGKATLKGDVIGRVNKGDQVTVLEEIIRNDSAPDEPSAWAKILLPPGVHAWVSGAYIDAASKTVKATKLRIRSGAGENFSILGELQKGDAIKELGTKDEWIEIAPPTNAYAFVAAQFLKQETPGTTTITNPVEVATVTPPEETKVTEPPTVATPPTEPPMTATRVPPIETTAVTPTPTTAVTTNETAATTEPAVEEPLPRRIVQREGYVRGTTSIQAPTQFELVSVDTHRTINYLYTTSPELDLRRYKGLRIIVSGEEGLDERWLNTPVITIERILLADQP